MKTPPDVPGTTRSCSYTSCFCDSLSCKHSLLRRILYLGPERSRESGKDLTQRERKLLSKLIAEYDKVKGEILNVNKHEQQKIDGLQRTCRQSNYKGTEDAEKTGAVLELVNLINKSQALGHNALSKCCSCCICNSSLCSYYKRHCGSHNNVYRTNYSSKSSFSRHNRTVSERTLRLKKKNVCSDPCTCITKLSSAITIEAKNNKPMMELNKLLSMDTNDINVHQKMKQDRQIKKKLKQITYSESSINRCLRGSIKSLNRKIRGEVKEPFNTITVLIKGTKCKIKESLLKKNEIVKSNTRVEERVGDSCEETLGNSNLSTSGGLAINTKLDSNEDIMKKVNLWNPSKKKVRLMRKSTQLMRILEPASETTTELTQAPKTRNRPENRTLRLNISRNSEHKQKQAGQKSCHRKLHTKPSQESKIRNGNHMNTKYGKDPTKCRKANCPSHQTCSSQESMSQNCYNLLSLRRARLAQTSRFNCWNIKEIIEKSLSDLEVIQPVIKSKFNKNIETMTSITDISKMFLNIEGKKKVKPHTVGICKQPTQVGKEGTKMKVLSNSTMEPSTFKPVEKACVEDVVRLKNSNKKFEKNHIKPKKQSNHKKLELLTIQRDRTLALSGTIDLKSTITTSKSLLLSNNYSQCTFKSLNSITLSGLKIDLLNQSSITSSYVPQCLCMTNAQALLTANHYNGSNHLDRGKVSISACNILTVKRQSVSGFSDKTKGIVSSVIAKSSLNTKTAKSQVLTNTMMDSTFKVSPFANVQTVYQCQPLRCPNVAVKPKTSKICCVSHKCESHKSVSIECDPNKCLKVVTKQLLKCKCYSSKSLKEAISTLNIACPCDCQKCQVTLPSDIQSQHRKSKKKFNKMQSKCPTKCFTLAPTTHQCKKEQADKKIKKSQLIWPVKRCRLSNISSSSEKRDLSVCESQMFIPIKCDPNKCLKVVTKKALKRKSHSHQSLTQVISALNIKCPCECQKCKVAPPPENKCKRKKTKEKLKQSQTTCLDNCRPPLEIRCQEKISSNMLKKMQSKWPDKCLASVTLIQCSQKKSDKKLKKSVSKCSDEHCRTTTTAISTCQSQNNQRIANLTSMSSPQGIRLTCSPRPSPYPIQCDPKAPGLLASTSIFIRRCFCKQTLKDNKDVKQCALIFKSKKKLPKENKAKHTSKTFECGDRNSVLTLNQSYGSTIRQKSSKKSKAINSVHDNKYSKDLANNVSNYSFSLEFCRSTCLLSDKNTSAVCKPVSVAKNSNNYTSCVSYISPVFSITMKPSQNSCFECESTSKEYLKNKPCKKKNSSSKTCENSKTKPVQCPSVKLKKPHKPQKSITVLTVCKEKKTCPSVINKRKRTSKNKSNYKESMCKPQKCREGIKICNKVKSPSVKVKCQPYSTITVCQNSSTSKNSKGSSIECQIKHSECHKSVKVSNGTKVKCCSSKECECKQIDPHKSISVCKSCKLQIKCMPLKSECKSTKTDRSVTVCNFEEFKCHPSVKIKCKCKPNENTIICENCKLQMKRTSVICKCKIRNPHNCVTTSKDKKQTKYDCKPTKSHKSSSSCKHCRSNKKIKNECVKRHKSVSVCKTCAGNKKVVCTPLICECPFIKPDKCRPVCRTKVECKGMKSPKKTSVCIKSNASKNKCQIKQLRHSTPLICECKSVKVCKECGKKNKKQSVYSTNCDCPLVVCDCKPQVKCKNKARSRAQQQKCCQPLTCECSSYMVDCGKVKNNKKSQISPKHEDITAIKQFINAVVRYFKSDTKNDQIDNHEKIKHKSNRLKAKTHDNVCPHCAHISKASQTSCKKTKTLPKKNQVREHQTEEACLKCKHNKVKSFSAPKRQMLYLDSESSSYQKPQKKKRNKCQNNKKKTHKCVDNIGAGKSSIKSFFMNFFKKNNKCTTTAENKNVQCPKAKMSTKGNKPDTQPCQALSSNMKKSKKKLKKCGSKGDNVSKKSNASTSTCYSISTQYSKKQEIKANRAYCKNRQYIQLTKTKATPKICKRKGCHSYIGDTGPIVKRCVCSSKSCKNVNKNICTNCHQVYYVETQPPWNVWHTPLSEKVPYECDPRFISSQYNRDMQKIPYQMGRDINTTTMYSAVGKTVMRHLYNLEIQTRDVPNTNIVHRVPIKVDIRNRQQKRHLANTPSPERKLSAPNEINTIFPYTPKKKLIKQGISKKEELQNLNYKQEIGQSPAKSPSCNSRRHENYDEMKQKNQHKATRKLKMSKNISSRVTCDVDQAKVNVKKHSSLGLARIINICVSLFTRQKKTASKPNTSKCYADCKDKLYQTVSLKIPFKKRCSLVTNVIYTSSKSDSQPRKQGIVRTNKTKSLTNSKKVKHKFGTKYNDLIYKQQMVFCPQYQSGDANEQVLNVPDICINKKHPDTERHKEILSYFCKPEFDTGKEFSPYARDYTVGYAFRPKKQKNNFHHPCTSGTQSSFRGLFKNAKSETRDKGCKPHCTTMKIKGILKKKPKSCCDVCCGLDKRTNSPEKRKERGSGYHKRNEKSSNNSSEGRKISKKNKTLRSYQKEAKTPHEKYGSCRSGSLKKPKSKKKQRDSMFYHHKKEKSTTKSARKPNWNKKHKTSRAAGPIPCDSTCLVNLTREGKLEKPKPKIQKPLRFRKSCREDCKHMKHLELVKIKKEEKKVKEARSQTKKITSRSLLSFLRSISSSIVGKSKTSVSQKKNDAPPLFEIQIDSKDYRVLNREQTIYSISEWQRKEMERRTAEARHGKNCRCCICVRSALQQSSHKRKKNAKTKNILKNPSIVECVCGSAVCDKERQKMIDQLEQEMSKQQAQKKPCVCGSKICAKEAEAALHKKGSKLKGKRNEKVKGKKKKKKKTKEKKDKKQKKDKHKKDKEKKEEKARKKMEKLKEKQEQKKKKPDKDTKKKEIEKAQEKLRMKEEKKKEKLEREKQKKEMKKPITPKKTARELLDEKMNQFKEARKKDYENWQKSREFKRDNKYEVAARERHKHYVAKMNRLESHATQERSEADMQLIAKSVADLWDVGATCVQSAARQSYRRIMQPLPKEKHIKRQDFKTNQYVVRTTFRNIQRRLLLTKFFGFIGKLGGKSNRYHRKRKTTDNWGCNMYMQTLRVKRCVWVYKTCPWFYPYCLNIITVWRHFAFFVLFFIGAILWTPCFFCMELCNLLLCCHC